MSRALWLADVLRDAGCGVSETPSWQTRGSDYGGLSFRAVMWHHTATGRNWEDTRVVDLLVRGRRDLSGPLANLGLDRDGTFHVIASGRANHAGSGGWNGLKGNGSTIGLEVFNDGRGEPWTPAQYDAAVRGSAAMLDRMRRGRGWVIGHKEWTRRKIDPFGIDMEQVRADVAAGLPAGEDDEMREGSPREGDVRKLQTRLNNVAKDVGFPRLSVDGDFGPKTKAAVEAFQRAQGLTVDGVVSMATAEQLWALAHGVGSHA